MTGARVQETQFVGGDKHEAGFVQTATTSAAEHLENFVGPNGCLDGVAAIGIAGEGDAAEREIDPGSKTHGGDDHAELAGFGERFNDARARAVAETAMVISDAAFEQAREMFADDLFLFGRKLKRVRVG